MTFAWCCWLPQSARRRRSPPSASIHGRRRPQGLSKLGWLFLTGLSTGSGIWATHFVAMLAYSAGLPTAYDPLLTAVSLLVAIGATTFGFFVCSHGTRLDAGVGGALIGLGIGVMHFTGMRALIVPGTLVWDTPLVVASLLLGAALASTRRWRFTGNQNFRGTVTAARHPHLGDLQPAFHGHGRGDRSSPIPPSSVARLCRRRVR